MGIMAEVVLTTGQTEIFIITWKSNMGMIRKLITKSPVSGAVLVRRFDVNAFASAGGIVGLTTSDFLYWEFSPVVHDREDVIYCAERIVEGDAVRTDGFVCNHYDSRDLIHEFGEISDVYGFMTDIEGVLDEGLLAEKDFSLVQGIIASDMLEREPLMMIGEAAKNIWWIYKIRLSVPALFVLLKSNTIGYQLGFSLVLRGGVGVRLVREVGFDMQSMDLILTDLELTDAVRDKAVSVF
jgi:hypothetical protein